MASEQERPDVKARRLAWFEAQPELDPSRLVFIDETGASTRMARLRGCAPRGARCRAAIPHGHGKTTTLVAALRLGGMTAPMVIDGAMNGGAFRAWVRHMLAPSLGPGDIVVMGNLPAHKVGGVRERIETRGARLLHLPPCSPGFQPDRASVRQAQGSPPQGGRPDPQNPRDCHRRCPRRLRTRRMRQLLHRRRL
jgi:hypothetical protein